MNWESAKSAAIVIVRHLLSVATGGFTVWASRHGFDVDGEVAILIGAIALFLVNLAWAVGSKFISKWKLDLALNLDASKTHADLNAIASAVPTLTQISQAFSTPTEETLTVVPVSPATLVIPVAPIEPVKDSHLGG